MICKYCKGTGTSNICVNGTFKPCSACNGTGIEEEPQEQTNEEWFDNLPPDKKAKIMIRLVNNLEKRELIAEWLREKHKNEMPSM